MKIYLYSYFNTEAGFHGPLMCMQTDVEVVSKNYVQFLVGMTNDALESLKSDDLYFMGTFDNVSGEIDAKREFVLHVGDVASVLISKRKEKEEKKDGKVA